jgi:hypothetical protein
MSYPLHGEKVLGIVVHKRPTVRVTFIFTLWFWYRFTPIGKIWWALGLARSIGCPLFLRHSAAFGCLYAPNSGLKVQLMNVSCVAS